MYYTFLKILKLLRRNSMCQITFEGAFLQTNKKDSETAKTMHLCQELTDRKHIFPALVFLTSFVTINMVVLKLKVFGMILCKHLINFL